MDSYQRSGNLPLNSNNSAVLTSQNIARLQILKTIKTKFYIHKSFELQSDLEFLPTIDDSTSMGNGIVNGISSPNLNSSVFSPNLMNNRLNEYYGQLDSGLNTPKQRMAYLNNSPKRSNASLNPNLRKRVISNGQSQYFQGNIQSNPGFNEQYVAQNQRNW